MAVEKITVARPYAEALFLRGTESGDLKNWSDKLSLLSGIITNPEFTKCVGNPAFGKDQLLQLLLDLLVQHVDDEARNFLQILIENNRLALLPEITNAFEDLRKAKDGSIDVLIVSAYEVTQDQSKMLTQVLKTRLGKNVVLLYELDPALIGGIKIRAGDLVVDGSLQNKINRPATEFRI